MSLILLVGAAGFELATYWSQTSAAFEYWRGLQSNLSNRPPQIVARFYAGFRRGVRGKSAALTPLFLTACGGGCDSPTPPQAPCPPVTIALYGDSTDAAPEARASLQALMDSRFGVGKVAVLNKAVSGTTSADLPAVGPEAVAIVNFGINDSRIAEPIDLYKANLRRLYRPGVVFKTPNPIWGHTYDPVDVDDQAYAQAMREVAVELGAPLIDTNGYVMGLQDWHGLVPDGLHPSSVLYGKIAEWSMATLAPLAESSICR